MPRLLDSCTKCHRIHQHLLSLKDTYKNYHNRPVKGSGSKDSDICIVGLAPGLHGANRTGDVFNGDFSGNMLNNCLSEAGFRKSFGNGLAIHDLNNGFQIVFRKPLGNGNGSPPGRRDTK